MNRHERRKAQKTKTRVRNFTYKQLHTDFDIHVDTGTSSRTGREIVEICASPAGRETVSELFPECEWVMGTPNYIPDDWRFTQIHVTRVPAHYTAKLLDDDGDYAIEAVAFAVASSLALTNVLPSSKTARLRMPAL